MLHNVSVTGQFETPCKEWLKNVSNYPNNYNKTSCVKFYFKTQATQIN